MTQPQPTESQRIFIVAPELSSLKKVAGWVSGSHFSWTYLGQGLIEERLSKETLGENGDNIDSSARFHEFTDGLRDLYLRYIHDLGTRATGLRWWLTSLSYRSAYVSQTFQMSAHLKIALESIKNWDGPGPLVIIAGERALRQAIVANLTPQTRSSVSIVGNSSDNLGRSIKDSLLALSHRSFFIYRQFRRLLTSRRIPSPKIEDLEGATLLLSSYHLGNAQLGGEYYRSVFGDLPSRLVESGHKIAYMPVILRDVDYRATLDVLVDANLPLALPHRFLTFRDVLAAVWSTLPRPPTINDSPRFDGMDIRPVMKEDLRRHWIRNEAADAWLMVPLAQRWAKAGANFARIIYTYENQPWERALCWQSKRSLPECRLTGYQYGRVPNLLLNWHLAPEEASFAPLPDRVVTCGQYGAQRMDSTRFKPGSLQVAGALQFGGVMERYQTARELRNGDSTTETAGVLVATSYGQEEAAELVDLISRLSKAGNIPVPVTIKCHPQTRISRLEHLLEGPVPSNIPVSEEPLSNLIPDSSLMVYTSSGACFEALSQGIPVIHYRSRFELDMDPLDKTPEARLAADNLEELGSQIQWLLENRDDYIRDHQDLWDQIIDDLYEPVTEDTYAAFAR